MANPIKSKPRSRRTNSANRDALNRQMIPSLPREAARVRASGDTIVPRSADLVPLLLHWFSANARDLPWRRTRDPYAIWVSEIMLQQTQVKTVIPYWERWMRELPSIQAAAKTSSAKLHKLWEGLGYYTRVRNLQKTAQQILAQHDGKFPENFPDILALSGIGRYTAGAISSIAFNQPTPILDGNVTRVLTRLFGLTTDPREKQTNAHLWQLAEKLVAQAANLDSPPNSRCGRARSNIRNPKPETRNSESLLTSAAIVKGSCSALNQSLMELGALICTPRSPECGICPVQRLCAARNNNLQDQLPNLGKRETTTARSFIAFVVARDGKFFVRQRPEGVVNAHLWEFPNVEIAAAKGGARHSSHADPCQLRKGAQRSAAPHQTNDFLPTTPKPLCSIKHSITRYRITLEAYRAEFAKPYTKLSGRWLTPQQLHKLAFTSAHKKILNHLGTPNPVSARRSGHP